MKRLVFLLFLCSAILQAQEHAWVYFKDKPNAQTFINQPLSILSQRAIDRRNRQDIEITHQDVPIESSYLETLKSQDQVEVKAISKWLNAIHVVGSQLDITNLEQLTFVDRIEFANKQIAEAVEEQPSVLFGKIAKNKEFISEVVYDYGQATNQNTMLGVDAFHDKGYNGQGLQIAVIDGGFYGVNTAGAFSHLLDGEANNGEILGGYDFVNSSEDFYQDTGSTHGTLVLSTIGAIKENEFVGTAPSASYYLFLTEDTFNETPLEESLWVQAAEKADSLGVDILNTSLGYSEFDNSKYNYSYEDMDGETTFITRGATIATQKGMLVVNSIGNSGRDPWRYLTAPADAKNSIAVGGVDQDKELVDFSSFGPSFDGRTKPETLAKGLFTSVVNEHNEVVVASGTSFSSPLIAGVAACLWQAYPDKTSLEIRQIIIENSALYTAPTAQGGYGVFNAGNLVSGILEFDFEAPFYFAFTNDNRIQFYFNTYPIETIELQVFSLTGAILEKKIINENDNAVNLNGYANGVYTVMYRYMGNRYLLHYVKK